MSTITGDASRRSDEEDCINSEYVCLREKLRMLWEQHVYWTRLTIVSMVFNLPDAEATTKRLLQNATDFGRLFCRFYGKRVAVELESLIKAHLVIAAELVKAAKAGNSRAVADAEQRWYENADEITTFLNHINPHWPVPPMRSMWHEHLALTKQEAVLMLKGSFAGSIAAFDQIEQAAMMMADTFAEGIAEQFYS